MKEFEILFEQHQKSIEEHDQRVKEQEDIVAEHQESDTKGLLKRAIKVMKNRKTLLLSIKKDREVC
jgi:hypothetical protein